MASGVRLAIDWGKVRIGVAATDPTGTLCVPVGTYTPDPQGLDGLYAEVADRNPAVVYMGLPRTLRGEEGPAAIAIREAASSVAARIAPIPLRLVDERLTTAVAHRALAASGRSSRKRRHVVDQAAAVVILEQAVELERHTGTFPGELVEGNTQ